MGEVGVVMEVRCGDGGRGCGDGGRVCDDGGRVW